MIRDYNTYDDEALFNLVKQDDEMAFRMIYERYRRDLLAYVYNGLHIKEASEEVVQDVFSWLWDKRETTQIKSSLKSYLFTAARHMMLNSIRSSKMKKAYAADFYFFALGLHDNSNEEWQNLHDLEHVIEDSLSRLPERCQMVFRLSRKEHLPIQNIAAMLGISTKTVENYLTQALKHLRGSLER